MGILQIAAAIGGIFLTAGIWSLANRGRGWGGGKTKTGQWFAKYVINRETMAVVCAASLAGYLYALTGHLGVAMGLFVVVFLFWWLGVLFGWGEYFDGSGGVNHEIAWIDRLMLWVFHHYPMTGDRIDNISMGLRGTYYLPMFIMAGVVTHSWWFALPAAFFWQDGFIYGQAYRDTPKGQDFVRVAEFSGGGLRGFFMALATLLSVVY